MLDFLSFFEDIAPPAIVDKSITNSNQDIAFAVPHIRTNCVEGSQPESLV